MSMKDTLKKAKIAAMKAKDKAKLNPINLTLADIQNLEIANGHEATDEEVLKVIQKGVKTRRETAKLYEDKGLADKAAPETAEADFLETFLPAAASDEDYAKAVADAVAEVNPAGPKDMGRVVKAARAALAGKTIDGGKLAGLVKASRGCYDFAMAYDAPFISGKDSLNNEYIVGGESLAIPGTLLVTAVAVMPDADKAVSMDLKEAGNLIYMVGLTRHELGGSEYLRRLFLDDDLAEGKPTLPLIHAMRQASEADRALLVEAIVERNGLDHLDAILAILHATGAIEYSHQRAKAEAAKAKAALACLPDGPYRQALFDLADMAVARVS